MRIFTTGAESGEVEFNGGVVSNVYGYVSPTNSTRRTGQYAYAAYSGNTSISYANARQVFSSNESELFGRVAFYQNNSSGDFILLAVDGQQQIKFSFSTTALTVGVTIGSQTLIGTSQLFPGNWYILEWHVKISAAAGEFVLRINGVTDITFSGNTDPLAKGYVNNFYITSTYNSGGEHTWFLDDIAINNTAGSYQNSWIGPGVVYLLRPTGAGSSTQWTPAGATANWQCVDEVPQNGNTDYVVSDQLGALDLYTMTDLPPQMLTVDVVEPIMHGALSEAGVSYVKPVLRVGETNYEYDAYTIVNVQPSYQRFRGPILVEKPGGGVWTPEDINAMEAGIKVA